MIPMLECSMLFNYTDHVIQIYYMIIYLPLTVINHADCKPYFVNVKIISESCVLLKCNIYTDIIT